MWTREKRVDDFEFGMDEAEITSLRQQSRLEIFEGFGHGTLAPAERFVVLSGLSFFIACRSLDLTH